MLIDIHLILIKIFFLNIILFCIDNMDNLINRVTTSQSTPAFNMFSIRCYKY